MNTVFVPSAFLLPLALHRSAHYLHLQRQYNCCSNNRHRLYSRSFMSPVVSCHSLSHRHSSTSDTAPTDEGAVAVMNFEDFPEKDWSFLETGHTSSDEGLKRKIDLILSAGEIKEDSRVLVSIGSEGFVDQLVNSSSCQLLLVVHDSLIVLACIKEKYDTVKCWQGELIYVPEKWAPIDVVFLYFLPSLPFTLDQVFEALGKRCSPGARIVISHPQGREVLDQQRRQFPDVVASDLPDKMTLQNVAANHSFQMIEYVDKPCFYLVVLKFSENDMEK